MATARNKKVRGSTFKVPKKLSRKAFFPKRQSAVKCGDTIGSSVTLKTKSLQNCDCSSRPALSIAKGAQVMLSRSTIVSCASGQEGTCIQLEGSSGTSISGGTITNCETGIMVAGNGGNQVKNVNILAPILGDGISIPSNGNTISSVYIQGASNSGISLTGANKNLLTGNIIKGTVKDGIVLSSNSTNTRIVRNRIESTGGAAIVMFNSPNTRIARNEIENTHVGQTSFVESGSIFALETNNIQIMKNTLKKSGLTPGILVLIAQNVLVSGNTISQSGNDGMVIAVDISNVNITRNHILETGLVNASGSGIDVTAGEKVQIRGNVIVKAGDEGIDLNAISFATVANNRILKSRNDGIELASSSNIKIAHNRIVRSGDNGIELSQFPGLTTSSNNNQIVGNSIARSGRFGIFQESGATGNTLQPNKIKRSGEGMIETNGMDPNVTPDSPDD